jgi:hypothetical protein
MAVGLGFSAIGSVHHFQPAGGFSANGELALSESGSTPGVGEAIKIRTPRFANSGQHCRRVQFVISDGSTDVKGVGGHEV